MLTLFREQISKHKSVASYDFSHFDQQVVSEHRARIDERVEFSVLAAGIDVWRQIREQSLIEFPPDEFRGQALGVNASEFCAHATLDHRACKLPGGHSPHRENWLQPRGFQLLLAVCPYVVQE